MKLFSLDSPLMKFMGIVANLMILNLITIFCSIPVFTAGAAITALYYVTIKMVKGEDPYIVKNYFKSFKQNFKQATIIWILLLLVCAALFTDWKIATTALTGDFAKIMKVLVIFIAVFVLLTTLYVFAVLSRFDNTVGNTIKNALLMGIVNFPKSIVIAILHLTPVAMVLASEEALPMVFLLGFSTVAYLCSMVFVRIFKRFEPEGEGTPAEDEYQPLSFMVEEENEKKEALAAEQEETEEAAEETVSADQNEMSAE